MSIRTPPVPVSSAEPCVLCGHSSWCSRTRDGLYFCMRTSGNREGFRWLSASKTDAAWHLFRREGDALPMSARPATPLPPAPTTPSVIDWQAEAVRHRATLTSRRAEQLAGSLGLPTQAIDLLELIGWSREKQAFTIPERDGAGCIVGLSLRWLDGRKRVQRGGRRGLFVPVNWMELLGSVRVPEGASDVLALAWYGVPCVGRPSAMAGADLLAGLLRDVDRPLVVLGENDIKDDGRWPGREGAVWMAERLRQLLPGREVLMRLPPQGFKDVRAWVLSSLAARASD